MREFHTIQLRLCNISHAQVAIDKCTGDKSKQGQIGMLEITTTEATIFIGAFLKPFF